MKFFGLLFIAVVGFLVYKTAHADVPHNNAYCSGYASKMSTVYRSKYYRDMQQYFDSKTDSSEVDDLTAEYSQSGAEAVKLNASISENLVPKCEDAYKRRM